MSIVQAPTPLGGIIRKHSDRLQAQRQQCDDATETNYARAAPVSGEHMVELEFLKAMT